MRILYIHQYFASRQGKTGTRSYEFGRYLVSRGHEVTMITSGLANAEFPVGPNERSHEYEIGGIRVISVAAGYNDPYGGTALSGWRRMLQFQQFAKAATAAGQRLAKPEMVFATHTPLTVGLAGMELSRHFGVPFVFEVRDLWPDALINVGAVTNPIVIWWLRRMAHRIYRAGPPHCGSIARHERRNRPGRRALREGHGDPEWQRFGSVPPRPRRPHRTRSSSD